MDSRSNIQLAASSSVLMLGAIISSLLVAQAQLLNQQPPPPPLGGAARQLGSFEAFFKSRDQNQEQKQGGSPERSAKGGRSFSYGNNYGSYSQYNQYGLASSAYQQPQYGYDYRQELSSQATAPLVLTWSRQKGNTDALPDGSSSGSSNSNKKKKTSSYPGSFSTGKHPQLTNVFELQLPVLSVTKNNYPGDKSHGAEYRTTISFAKAMKMFGPLGKKIYEPQFYVEETTFKKPPTPIKTSLLKSILGSAKPIKSGLTAVIDTAVDKIPSQTEVTPKAGDLELNKLKQVADEKLAGAIPSVLKLADSHSVSDLVDNALQGIKELIPGEVRGTSPRTGESSPLSEVAGAIGSAIPGAAGAIGLVVPDKSNGSAVNGITDTNQKDHSASSANSNTASSFNVESAQSKLKDTNLSRRGELRNIPDLDKFDEELGLSPPSSTDKSSSRSTSETVSSATANQATNSDGQEKTESNFSEPAGSATEQTTDSSSSQTNARSINQISKMERDNQRVVD